MINSNHIKRGMVLNIDGDLQLVQSFQHHKPGKGAAVVRVKLKSLSKGTTVEKTFRSGEMLEDVELDKRPVTYSYDEGDSIVFMDTETYDQISIPKEDIGDLIHFMKEGMELNILLHEGNPVSILPPNFTELEVTYAEEGLKGDTATNATKEVTLETGAKLQVPLFVKAGDVVKVDLRDFSYVERVSK
ncbi:MAG: elongation factor P [Candidatus Hydrogenedentota bacterium]|nr:MAG: elongation factor P [Candidatus Hydrogenedentota bacterium]